MPDALDRPTERHLCCRRCRHPRHLASASGPAAGAIRIPCPKCRTHCTFDLQSGRLLDAPVVRAGERELRCGNCRGFLAGVKSTAEGQVRIPCTKLRCKRHNTFQLKPAPPERVPVPTS